MCAAITEIFKTKKRPGAKDRIFTTAKDLFYRHGIRAVGVESIASEANATKMTLYRNFNSKDELVAECLRDHDRDFWKWWNNVVAKADNNPKAQLQALMEGFSHSCEDHPRGCPMAIAVVELDEENKSGRAVIIEHKNKIRAELGKLCTAMKVREPETLADALHLLIEGAFMSQMTFREKETPSDALPRISEILIKAHLG